MKRIALIFILILTFNTVFSQAKIGTDGSVEPTGNFPAMKDEFLKGSMRVVADTTARNAIPSVFRKNGMLVYDQALKTLWVLDSSTSPIWKNYLASATVDSTTYATRARLYKVADSLGAIVGTKLNISDSATFSTKAWRQKGDDSVSALISPRITDSLRSLVRLRASGSGGIQLQNSVGTNVADFGIANTTNGSIAGGWNVGGNSTISGTLGVTQKATFSDSIVGQGVRFNTTGRLFKSSGQIGWQYYSNTNGWFSGLDQSTSDSAFVINYDGAYNSSLRNVFYAKKSGQIGLGTNNPLSKFQVFDDVSTSSTVATFGTQNNGLNIKVNSDGSNEIASVAAVAPIYISQGSTKVVTISDVGAATFSGALTATAQGNNIAVGVDSSVTSTSYTLVLGDAGYLKRCDNASTITITVPNNSSVAFPIGTTIYFSQKGAGKVNLSAASGVNLRSEGNLLGTAGQNAVIGIIKVNTNDFLVVGNRG